MKKEFLKKQKEKLGEEKKKLETQLNSFATKSTKVKGGWAAKMPLFNGGHLEEEADEVEEFSTRLALEKTLEKELQDVNSALENIKKGKYGLCEKCHKPISKARLEALAYARFCKKCQI